MYVLIMWLILLKVLTTTWEELLEQTDYRKAIIFTDISSQDIMFV